MGRRRLGRQGRPLHDCLLTTHSTLHNVFPRDCFVPPQRQILDCLDLPEEYRTLLTTDDKETNLHAGEQRRQREHGAGGDAVGCSDCSLHMFAGDRRPTCMRVSGSSAAPPRVNLPCPTSHHPLQLTPPPCP